MPSFRATERRRGTRSSSAAESGMRPKRVAQSLLEGFELVGTFDAVEFLVEGYALALLRHVVEGQQQLEVALDNAVGNVVLGAALGVALEVGELLGAQLGHGLAEDFLICLVAQVGDKAALLGTEQVAGTAYVEVLHGNVYARAEVAEALDGL